MTAPTSYAELAGVLEALPLLVREARRARGLSLRAAAEQLGCSATTIMRFEGGDGTGYEFAVSLLRWLDLVS